MPEPAPAPPGPPAVTVLHAPAGELEAIRSGAAIARADLTVIGVSGPGAVQCIQGLLTNDVVAPGERGFVYGALLTTKGMIVTDLWTLRCGAEISLFVPREGATALQEAFARYVPPRLARITDRTSELAVFEILGPSALERAARQGIEIPVPGRSQDGTCAGVPCTAARPGNDLPFALLITCAIPDRDTLEATLVEAGVPRVGSDAARVARVLAGWPRLGAEIDEKTLPQEVRLDEIGGVSYTKGCYTGQETVARLHFRGHANRYLARVEWHGAPDPADSTVVEAGRPVGRVTSALHLPPSNRWIGLAIVRREVAGGATVTAAGAEATVSPLS